MNKPTLFVCCLLLLAAAFAVPHSASAINGTVKTESGLVEGYAGASPNMRIFKGIPYAAPPVGELRWKAPQPAAKWDGVRKADKFSESCIQPLSRSHLPWTKEYMAQNEISEDCLCLNVWTAAKSANEKRPVMVWIYGGAFNEGSTEIALYDGEEWARKGAVAVTINYRVGLMGFFTHPDLTKESGHNSSGNYGLLDMVAALQWVQRNIAAFGGDPNNVTIVGQSAGAAGVHALTASPLANGLFHRAIAQSGSSFNRTTRSLADSEKDGVRFAESMKAKSLKELRAMSYKELTASGVRFGPVVDGWFLPEDVPTIFAKGKQNDVPTLTGLMADEGSASATYGKVKAEDFRKQAQQRFQDSANAFLKLYPANDDAQAGMSQKLSAREQGIVSMYMWAAERAKTAKTKAYTYFFTRAIPWPEHPEFQAFHSGELPYTFGNLKVLDRPWEPIDRKLADTVTSYWVNFARTGNPNGKGLPVWPAFDAKSQTTMELGEKIGPRPLTEKAKSDFFIQYFDKQRARTGS